jgi:hypothetical protein
MTVGSDRGTRLPLGSRIVRDRSVKCKTRIRTPGAPAAAGDAIRRVSAQMSNAAFTRRSLLAP